MHWRRPTTRPARTVRRHLTHSTSSSGQKVRLWRRCSAWPSCVVMKESAIALAAAKRASFMSGCIETRSLLAPVCTIAWSGRDHESPDEARSCPIPWPCTNCRKAFQHNRIRQAFWRYENAKNFLAVGAYSGCSAIKHNMENVLRETQSNHHPGLQMGLDGQPEPTWHALSFRDELLRGNRHEGGAVEEAEGRFPGAQMDWRTCQVRGMAPSKGRPRLVRFCGSGPLSAEGTSTSH